MSTPPDVTVRWVGPNVVVETECERVASVVASLVCGIEKVDPDLGQLIAQLMHARALLAERGGAHLAKQEQSN
jgi:hypothetical protein